MIPPLAECDEGPPSLTYLTDTHWPWLNGAPSALQLKSCLFIISSNGLWSLEDVSMLSLCIVVLVTFFNWLFNSARSR